MIHPERAAGSGRATRRRACAPRATGTVEVSGLVRVAGQTDVVAVADARHQIRVERHVEGAAVLHGGRAPAAVARAELAIALAELRAGDRGLLGSLQVRGGTHGFAAIRRRGPPTAEPGNAVVPVLIGDEVGRL